MRLLAFLSTGVEFALALRLSNLSEPAPVLSFLLLPFSKAFDPSLAFLAAGALPVSTILYQVYRGPEKPRLGGSWTIPKAGKIDAKLLVGAAVFGIGWGMAGICRMSRRLPAATIRADRPFFPQLALGLSIWEEPFLAVRVFSRSRVGLGPWLLVDWPYERFTVTKVTVCLPKHPRRFLQSQVIGPRRDYGGPYLC